ncbi:ubiquitin-associated protein 1-like [Oryzias melastigma]|uniref:Ubiquitin-associated protein 1-like n=1 Tax=Oryzias melastigma TaxID=30732 RepID=A0A3B3CC63_ORYME|nr:ubiquitin-associated protein 1-like [Oryzias melastigma]XP_036068233.1 ubiquitin-associated protein 1-like [Oryzias melastigma]
MMNIVEDVPFQTPVGPLGAEVTLVDAPEIALPDCHKIMQETQYEFNLERWIVCGQAPSCPPFWMMFSDPKGSGLLSHRNSSPWAPRPRPRSHSLSSADTHRLYQRNFKFSEYDSDYEDGYYDDNKGASAEAARLQFDLRERPRSAAPRDPLSRVKDMHLQRSSQTLTGHRATSSLPDCRQPLRALEQHRSKQASPLSERLKNGKRRQCSAGRKHSQNTPPAQALPKTQQRPSSAGPVVTNRRKKALTAHSGRGVFFDSAAELLMALSKEERELLETITDKGYPLRTAILALQKTGYRTPEKVLKYLVASDHLCQLGYDEAQVEEALEMFQNCESKAAEFLRLLTQFNEMGFQQSAIKEVLLVHENHRERALEELMTRMA